MDSARWQQIQAVFYEALEHPESTRQSFLEAACAGDAELMAEVQAMLKSDSGSASLLDRGLPEVAHRILGERIESVPVEEVGPYRLKEILGQGGMGVVCLAEREDTGAPVAIKFLLHAGLSAPRRERFAREIKTLARLRHQYIARLYDAGSLADGTPWFVMEYVEGVPITSYCREKQLPVSERLRLFRSVCEAVQYAYRQGIIHCDLKPSNILVEKDGTPRLLDFGIARHLQDPEEAPDQPPSSLRFGSPEYAAPEWIREGMVGAYTDVYSLGVMLFELLAGRLPHAGEGPAEKPSVASGSKAAGSDLDALCLKAMHRDAQQRYQSVEQLIRDIDHFLKCQPLEARPGTVANRMRKFVRRNWRPVLAAGVASGLIVGLVAFFTVRLARARNAALAEAARTKTIQRFMLNLFDSGKPEAAPANDLRAITILERGVKEAGSLNSDPETQAELYESLGNAFNMLGRFEESERLLLLALDKMKAARGAADPKVAEVLLRLAILRGDRSQPKDAMRFAQDGLALAERHAAPDSLLVIEAKSVLGRVTAQAGSYEKAIAILEPLVKLEPSGEEAAYDLADNLIVMGVCDYSLGRLDAAEALEQRALALHRQLAGEFHPRTANDLFNLGQLRAARAQYAEAEKYYREAIQIMEAWYGRDHPDTATFIGVFARTLLLEGKSTEAEGLLRRVLETQQRAYGGRDVRIAVTLDSLGKIAEKRGDLRAAQADFSRAFDIAQTIWGGANYNTAILKADLGDAHLRRGRIALAEQELREAVQVLVAKLPPGDAHIGAVEASWGRSLLREKRYVEAEKQLAAGHEILARQRHSPQIRESCEDLVAVYEALHKPDKAAKFRAELADTAKPN